MKKCIILFCLNISLVLSVDMNFSLETKYGDGNKITRQGSIIPDTSKYKFIENILDINTTFDNGLYIFMQVEYSDPPVFGSTLKGFNSAYLEYFGDNYAVKAGNLYSLYGRGLSLNMSQSQTIDFDNSVRGVEFKYMWNNLIFYGLAGASHFKYRSNPAFEQPDLLLDNTVLFTGSEYYSDIWGTIQYSLLHEDAIISSADIETYSTGISDLSLELSDRISTHNLEIPQKDTLTSIDHNICWGSSFRGVDFYVEKVWNSYTKILGEQETGSKLYMSLYTDLFGFGITYEYKNYNQKYYLPTVSNAPIVFREGNSTLASQNNHSINWGDEIGHQLEVNKALSKNFNMVWNLSMAYRHSIDTFTELSLSEILIVDSKTDIYAQYPFRQTYLELSGWLMSEKIYIKLAIDQFDELEGHKLESNSAFTVPTLLTFDMGRGNSITTYYEKQYREWTKWTAGIADKDQDRNYNSNYFSFTFNNVKRFSISFFYEDENYDKRVFGETWAEGTNVWKGIDLTGHINNTSQLSLFYGSQKGGLVCANGVCAEQPGFDDGIKVTFRTIL